MLIYENIGIAENKFIVRYLYTCSKMPSFRQSEPYCALGLGLGWLGIAEIRKRK